MHTFRFTPPIGLKYNGYRLWLERDGKCVRLITRGGYNWTDRSARAFAPDVRIDHRSSVQPRLPLATTWSFKPA